MSAKLSRVDIDLSVSVESGIGSGRFGILAGQEVARDGQKYEGGFRTISDVVNAASGNEVALLFGFEDYLYPLFQVLDVSHYLIL